ncbi:MAG: hypothetical protein L6Q71_09970, partial [Planctomycetes bacterium]|nr:hypothetical protein [Planctomycetota bacterium]
MKPVVKTNSSDLTRVLKLAATSWVLYDVANTVYAATITFLFVNYVQLQGGVFALGVTQTISMVLAGLTVPFLATVADRTGRAKTYLVVSTLVCIGAMASFAVDLPLVGLMLAFAIANFAYEYAMVFYNALLPSVAPLSRAGLVSGLGVGLGYIGTLLALFVLQPVEEAQGPNLAFVLGAAMFLVLALPCFLFV